MTVVLFRHPSDTAHRVSIDRCIVSSDHGWFEVSCRPGGGGWRCRQAYFGPKAGLQPLAPSMVDALRREIGYPAWLDAAVH